jgi:hypothetical protein
MGLLHNSLFMGKPGHLNSNVDHWLVGVKWWIHVSSPKMTQCSKLSMASFTVRFQSGWGRAFGANVQTNGRKTTGFSTMAMRPLTHHLLFDNSWLPNTLQWFPTPSIHLPSPPANFSYSPRWNYGWKGIVLTRLRRSTQKRERLSTHSHLTTSRDAWNHGKHAGIAIYMTKGTTSEETVETRSYGKELFLCSNSQNFWVAPCISEDIT